MYSSNSNYSTILVDSGINQLRYIAPIHQFQNWGPNQDLHKPLSNIISQVNAYNVMTITNTNIGIGTINPLGKLHIRNTNSSNTIIIDGNNSLSGINIVANNALSNNGFYLINDMSCNAIIKNNLGPIILQTPVGINVGTNLIIDSKNNIGIGGTTTSNLLSILGGGVSIGYNIPNIAQNNSIIVAGTVSIGTTAYNNALNIQGNQSITSNLYVFGNIGLGTSNVTNKINICGNVAIGEYAYSNYSAPYNGIIISGAVGIGTTVNLNNALNISGNTYVSGNIGIGILNPVNSFDVYRNVAIGNTLATIAPANGLYVCGNVAIGSTIVNANNAVNALNILGNVSIGYSDASYSPSTFRDPISGITGMVVKGSVGIGGSVSPYNSLEVNGGVVIGSYCSTSSLTSGTSLIVSGNVGIGINSPTSMLHVVGNANIGSGGITTLNNILISGRSIINSNVIISNANPNNAALQISQVCNNIPIATFTDISGGNTTPILKIGSCNITVGVGSTTLPYSLTVNGLVTNLSQNTANTISAGNLSTTGILEVSNGVAIGSTYIGNSYASANNLIISGNIGIATTNPGYKLHVIGNTYIGYNGTTIIDNLTVNSNLTVIGTTTIQNTSVTETQSFSISNATPTNNLPGLLVRQATASKSSAFICTVADFYDSYNSNANIPILSVGTGGSVNIGGTKVLSKNSGYTLNVNGTANTYNITTNTLNAYSNIAIGNINVPVNSLEISNGTIVVGSYTGTTITGTNTSIIASGNIGIGTTSPSSILHVVGSANIGVGNTTSINNLIVTGRSLTSNISITNCNVNIAGLQVNQYINTIGQPIATFTDITGGNTIPTLQINSSSVGIGGTGTNTNLIVSGAITCGSISAPSGVTLQVQGTITASNVTTTQYGPILSSNVFQTLLKLTTTTAVTANPLTTISQPAYVFGSAIIGGTVNTSNSIYAYPIISVDQYGRITNTSTQSITSSQWYGPGSVNPGLISFGGCVGIGITQSTSVAIPSFYSTAQGTSSIYLNVDGDIYASGDIIALSDKKYKTDLKIIDNSIEKIKQINGYTYRRIDIDNGQRYTGVIAQELEEVLPEAVQTNKNGDKSVAYGNVIGLLIECIKEQQIRIDKLETRLFSFIK